MAPKPRGCPPGGWHRREPAGGKLGEPAVRKKSSRASAASKAPPTYERYIYKLLKKVHPKMRISKQAMAIMNSQVNDTYERISGEAFKLSRLTKSQTLSARDISSACRLVLPGELSKHAVAEGSRCLMKYKSFAANRAGRDLGTGDNKDEHKMEKAGVDSPLEKEASID